MKNIKSTLVLGLSSGLLCCFNSVCLGSINTDHFSKDRSGVDTPWRQRVSKNARRNISETKNSAKRLLGSSAQPIPNGNSYSSNGVNRLQQTSALSVVSRQNNNILVENCQNGNNDRLGNFEPISPRGEHTTQNGWSDQLPFLGQITSMASERIFVSVFSGSGNGFLLIRNQSGESENSFNENNLQAIDGNSSLAITSDNDMKDNGNLLALTYDEEKDKIDNDFQEEEQNLSSGHDDNSGNENNEQDDNQLLNNEDNNISHEDSAVNKQENNNTEEEEEEESNEQDEPERDNKKLSPEQKIEQGLIDYLKGIKVDSEEKAFFEALFCLEDKTRWGNLCKVLGSLGFPLTNDKRINRTKFNSQKEIIKKKIGDFYSSINSSASLKKKAVNILNKFSDSINKKKGRGENKIVRNIDLEEDGLCIQEGGMSVIKREVYETLEVFALLAEVDETKCSFPKTMQEAKNLDLKDFVKRIAGCLSR